MSTCVVGGGIIGISTAYYLSLSRPPKKDGNPPIHIIDSASSLLLSASGFAGGFVALDWFSSSSASLGALSFRLHRELAQKHDGEMRWGYAGSHVYSLSVDERGVSKGKKKSEGEDWISAGMSRAEVAPGSAGPAEANGSGVTRNETLNPDGTPAWITPQRNGTLETIGTPSDCAQVEPRELCEFLLSECKSRGVQVHLSTRSTSLTTDSSNKQTHLNISQAGNKISLPCENLILTAGPWTPSLFSTLFPSSKLRIPITPLAGHSLLYKSPRYTTPFLTPQKAHMAYAIYASPTRTIPFAFEAFARLSQRSRPEIWIGGLNDSSLALPSTADDVKPLLNASSIAELRKTATQLSGLANAKSQTNEDDLEMLREALCFRPVSATGVPIIAKIPEGKLGGVKGNVVVASGHGPWGISLSLGTGLVVSEIVEDKKLSADVGRLGLR